MSTPIRGHCIRQSIRFGRQIPLLEHLLSLRVGSRAHWPNVMALPPHEALSALNENEISLRR